MTIATAIRGLLAFALALIATYLVACIAATQGALAALPALVQPIPMDVRLQTTLADLGGMAARFTPLLALALLAGFAIAATVIRWLPGLRTLGYVMAGFTALIAMHMIMKSTFNNIDAVAATRTVPGLLTQGLAGACGGWVFAGLSSRSARAASA
jgi:hypothetical protein